MADARLGEAADQSSRELLRWFTALGEGGRELVLMLLVLATVLELMPSYADDALVGLMIDPSPARDADIAVSRLLQSVHEGFGRVGVIFGAALGHDEVQLLRRVRGVVGRYQHVLVCAGVNLHLWDLIVRCVGSIILGCGCSAGPLEPRLERRHVCLIFGAGRVRGCRHAGGRSRGSVTAVVCLPHGEMDGYGYCIA